MAAKPTVKPRIGRPLQAVPRNTLGGKIREARSRARLSAIALAQRIGIKHQSLTAIERNEAKPEDRTLILLAEALKETFGLPWLEQYATAAANVIPVVAYVAGGRPIVEDITDKFVSVSAGMFPMHEGAVALKVRGDSMVEQHILNDDVLICHRSPEPPKGTIVVVDLKGERGAAVKRIERKGGTIYLYAERNAGDDEKQKFQDWEVGKVFAISGLIRRMR